MHDQFLILKKHEDILTAQHQAQLEYERFFKQYSQYIYRAEHVILRELYADEGTIGYLIRIEFTEQTALSDVTRMQEWASECIRTDLPFSQRWVSPVYKIPPAPQIDEQLMKKAHWI